MENIERERELAVAERLLGMAVYCLREARTTVGNEKIPLRLIQEVQRVEHDTWKRSTTAAPQKI